MPPSHYVHRTASKMFRARVWWAGLYENLSQMILSADDIITCILAAQIVMRLQTSVRTRVTGNVSGIRFRELLLSLSRKDVTDDTVLGSIVQYLGEYIRKRVFIAGDGGIFIYSNSLEF